MTRVANASILPTMLDYLAIDARGATFSAPSLAHFLRPEAENEPGEPGPTEPRPEQTKPEEAGPIVSTAIKTEGHEGRENRESVIFEDRKFIRGITSGEIEVYDLERDPGERFRIDDDPFIPKAIEILKRHREQAERLRAELDLEDLQSDLDADTIQRLKDMGYF